MNAHLFPRIAEFWQERPSPGYRAAEIGKRLTAYDIIGLNEVFDQGHRDTILLKLREAWGGRCYVVTSPKRLRSRFGADSGLVLVSRWPTVESHSIVYGNDSPIRKYGLQADGFSAKGALHARI